MSTELGLAIRRKSATPASSTGIRRDTTEIAKLVDIDLCIGCKACEVACKEWNDLPAEHTANFGSYQSHEDLSASTWDLMRFNEVELPNHDVAWLIRKDSCLHCEEPGCLLACPAPGIPFTFKIRQTLANLFKRDSVTPVICAGSAKAQTAA